MPSAKSKPSTIDEYLAAVKPAARAVLETLRKAIHAAAPEAQESIGYGLAGFKLNGRPLVYFGAWPNHCALYAASPKTQGMFADELRGYEVSKGTIRFTVEKPLPTSLVKKLVRARVAENAATQQKRDVAQKSARKSKDTAKSAPAAKVQPVLARLRRRGGRVQFRPAVTATLAVRGWACAMEFYQAAFGARETYQVPGGGVGRLSVGGAEFWVAEESPPHLNFSPESLGGCSVRMLLIVQDPAEVCARAVNAGATQVLPVADAHGWRLGRIRDPFGHHWEIGRPLKPAQS